MRISDVNFWEKGIALLLFLASLLPNGTKAQTVTYRQDDFASASLRHGLGFDTVSVDSGKTVQGQAADTSNAGSELRSPLVAVLLSAAIPGGGQVYNGSYWKVPIIIGAQVFFVTQWLSSNKSYEYYRTQYSNSISIYPPYGNLNLKDLRDSYRDQRDSYAWYMAGVYLLSLADAYVDAELSGFEVSPNLSSTPAGTAVALNLRIRF